MISIQVVFGLATSLNLEIEQLDVKTTFLHEDLVEEINMEQFYYCEEKGKEHLVYNMKNSLYRLKEAPMIQKVCFLHDESKVKLLQD